MTTYTKAVKKYSDGVDKSALFRTKTVAFKHITDVVD